MALYSFSGLSSTLPDKYGCWHKFYCRYVLQLPSRPGHPLIFGKACHSVIEAAIKNSNQDIIPILAQAVAGTNDLEEEELLKCVDIPIVHKAIQEGGSVEEYFQFPLEKTPYAPELRGYIDLNQVKSKEVVITDWKSNQRMYKPLDTYQLPLYAARMREQYKKPVIGRLAFLRFNKVEEHLFTDAEINEALDWARETAYECETRKDQVEMGADPLEIFPKSAGDACEYCDYKHYCLATTQEIPEAIASLTDAQKALQGIAETEEQLKIHKDRLKKFIETNGSIQTGRHLAEVNVSEYMKFDLKARKAVVAEMQKQKLDIGSILKIGSDAQKDLIAKHGWTEKTFLALGATKGKTSRLTLTKL